MKSAQSHRARRGYTLVELMMVIPLMSLTIGGAAVLLHGAWRVEQVMRYHDETINHITQLADQFRRDVHAANSASIDKPSGEGKLPSFFLSLNDGRQAQYQLDNFFCVERTMRRGDVVLAHESFALPPKSAITFEVGRPNTQPTLSKDQASLIISYPLAGGDFSSSRELRIDATLGTTRDEARLQEGHK